MEMEGLKLGLEYFNKCGVKISAIISDRHVSIQKFLRENYPMIKHYYDVWHVAKGINKKRLAASKLTGYVCIRPWISGVVGHHFTKHHLLRFSIVFCFQNARNKFIFFYDSLLSRNLLAALHYNENGDKQQTFTQYGDPRWKKVNPKAKGGRPVAKPVFSEMAYGYVEGTTRRNGKSIFKPNDLKPPSSTPGTLLQQYSEGVQKADVVAQLKTRFPNN